VSVVTTQGLSSGECCRPRHDIIPVKECICKRLFLQQ